MWYMYIGKGMLHFLMLSPFWGAGRKAKVPRHVPFAIWDTSPMTLRWSPATNVGLQIKQSSSTFSMDCHVVEKNALDRGYKVLAPTDFADFGHRILENTKAFLCLGFCWSLPASSGHDLGWGAGRRAGMWQPMVKRHGFKFRRGETIRTVKNISCFQLGIQFQSLLEHQTPWNNKNDFEWICTPTNSFKKWTMEFSKLGKQKHQNQQQTWIFQVSGRISGCFIRELVQLCGGNLSMEWSMWGAVLCGRGNQPWVF